MIIKQNFADEIWEIEREKFFKEQNVRGIMEFAIKEIKRIIKSAIEDADWSDKDYLLRKVEEFIEKVKIEEGIESP